MRSALQRFVYRNTHTRNTVWSLALVLTCGLLASGCSVAGGDEPPPVNPLPEQSIGHTGLYVVAGDRDGTLAIQLARQDERALVHVLALDDASLRRVREHLKAEGVDHRATAEQLPLAPLPYPENTVNLLVVPETLQARTTGLKAREVFRVLTPRGRVWLGGLRIGDEETVQIWEKAGFDDVSWQGDYLSARKPVSPDLDEWTHRNRDAAGNRASRDQRVGPPTALKWIDRPLMHVHHFSRPLSWVSGGGRVYYIYDESNPRLLNTKWYLVARDAFNGRLLWRRPIPDSDRRLADRLLHTMVVQDGILYAHMGDNRSLVALDGETGEILRDYGVASPIILKHEGKLVFSGGPHARDPQSGEVLWRAERMASPRNMVAGDGKLFVKVNHDRRRDRDRPGIRCLDINTGEELWWQDTDLDLHSFHRGRVILEKSSGPQHFSPETEGQIAALDANNGAELWTHTYLLRGVDGRFGNDLFCIGERLWFAQKHLPSGEEGWRWRALDISTGEIQTEIPYPPDTVTSKFRRCGPNIITPRYFLSGPGMDFLNREGELQRSLSARGSCHTGLHLANGMIYAYPVECGCFRRLRGVVGLAREENPDETAPEAGRAVRHVQGPAYGQSFTPDRPVDTEREWPIYRQNAERGGGVAKRVETIKPLWKISFGSASTAPTVAYDKVFLASSRPPYRVAAFDAATGEERWSFDSVAGPVDTPPTLHAGLCIFGSRNGWIYALRARDGALVWKYRVARRERRIIALGRLESPTPVYGSVLAEGGTVYYSAGWTSELDEGVRLGALDLATGRPKWERSFSSIEREELEIPDRYKPFLSSQTVLSDILAGDSARLFIRGLAFNKEDGLRNRPYPVLRPLAGFLDDTMRLYWRYGNISGRMLAVHESTVCGFHTQDGRGRSSGRHPIGEGAYTLFGRHQDDPDAGWDIEEFPIAVEALVLAGDTLLVAGPPDAHPGEAGALLWRVCAREGRKLDEQELPAPPVFDGMASAYGRVYMVTNDGTLHCFGKE